MIPQIYSGKGKEYSAVSNETEVTFDSWLRCCDLKKSDFLDRVNSNKFELDFFRDNDSLEIIMKDGCGNIGIPFVWENHNGKGILMEHFCIDAGMILAYISSMCHNELSKQKINDFIKYKLLKI